MAGMAHERSSGYSKLIRSVFGILMTSSLICFAYVFHALVHKPIFPEPDFKSNGSYMYKHYMSIHYSWTNKSGTIIEGEPFAVEEGLLKSLNIPMQQFITLDKEIFNSFVFVTCASANHFSESKTAIESVQKSFPNKTVIYFDLGLTEIQIAQVKTWCSVIYRLFHTERYPPHVARLLTYAFKPLLINEVLQTHTGVFYIDSSVRFKNGNLEPYYEKISTFGVLHFCHTGHSIYSATHPNMFDFLPTDKERMKSTEMTEGGVILLFRTKQAYTSFFYWWVLCALDENCTAPKGSKLYCSPFLGWNTSANCHRFDQSSASILLANLYNFDVPLYAPFPGMLLAVKRYVGTSKVRICEGRSSSENFSRVSDRT